MVPGQEEFEIEKWVKRCRGILTFLLYFLIEHWGCRTRHADTCSLNDGNILPRY